MIKKEHRQINITMVLKVMGWLLMIESGFMAIPAVVSLCYYERDCVPIFTSALITLIAGFALNKGLHPARTNMAKREGFLLTAMVWVVFSVFGMLPFLFCSTPLPLTDAFYEAMGGFTTTGATIFDDVEGLSHGINLWRALMQWLGGMGIILFTLAVLPMLNSSGGMQMFNAEVTGITHDKIRPRISQTAKGLWGVYFSLTALCAFLLWIGPMDLFESICHAFGTVSTGGFSTRASGVCDWDSIYIYVIIGVFMLLGGVNFSLIYFAAHWRFGPLKRNATLRSYLKIILLMWVIYAVAILIDGFADLRNLTVYPLFQVLATMTSTGYAIPDLKIWGPLGLALMVPMMFFGACAGSTSGGAKIDRLMVMVRYLRNSVKTALQPNSVAVVKIDGRVLTPDLVSKTVAFLCLYVIVSATGGVVLAAMGVPVLDSFFFALSCTTNLGVGPDAAGVGPGLAAIPDCGKWVLCALMLIGRLEIFTILILFTPSFWHK
ncbi:MAG: TrkH family potassium uptake protein [Bacteroidales bacterium]|nr:TrkH family potassium uptake protein [Bacteroidales bacterium]